MAHHKHQQGTSAINLAALSIAFEHPAISTELWILCAAARSCKAWREAVQQCAACNTAVEVCLAQPLSDLCSFARWLPKHALLVKSSNITAPRWREQVDGLPWGLHLEAAQQLLQMALQMATAPPVAAAAAAAPPPLPAIAAEQITAPYQPQQLLQQSWQQQLVRLLAISSITMMCTKNNMLAALPAHSLTHLYLKTLEWPYGRLAFSAALTRLSNLQQLHLVYPDTEAGSCLTGLAQLTQLTLLELDCYYTEKSMLQQLLAQPLPLRVLRLQSAYWEDHLDLSHLTQLQEFSNKESCRTSGELNTSFPEQLQKLEAGPLHHEDDFQALLQLQQLQSLAFADYVGDPELLLRLAQLPALQQLAAVCLWRCCC
uniref:F-box domain-containing protein n=1 Tax=Tetradesmus obliquus TaxID=3088 RepID=A0A383V7H8_TETOB|eukprot:jgi/Sobl393_1/6120/SZX61547.1